MRIFKIVKLDFTKLNHSCMYRWQLLICIIYDTWQQLMYSTLFYFCVFYFSLSSGCSIVKCHNLVGLNDKPFSRCWKLEFLDQGAAEWGSCEDPLSGCSLPASHFILTEWRERALVSPLPYPVHEGSTFMT